ncbi:hypothetical protein AB1N83_005150 [Pleurotus pulmonarius]
MAPKQWDPAVWSKVGPNNVGMLFNSELSHLPSCRNASHRADTGVEAEINLLHGPSCLGMTYRRQRYRLISCFPGNWRLDIDER